MIMMMIIMVISPVMIMTMAMCKILDWDEIPRPLNPNHDNDQHRDHGDNHHDHDDYQHRDNVQDLRLVQGTPSPRSRS